MHQAKRTTVELTDIQANILGHMGYAASKLWNAANFERKNWQLYGLDSMPSKFDQTKSQMGSIWYASLPSQSAQAVIFELGAAWNSYMSNCRNGQTVNPHPPRYRQAPMPVTWVQNGIKHGIGSSRIRLSIPKAMKDFMREHYDAHEDYIWIENDLFGSMDHIKEITFKQPEDNKPDKNGRYPKRVTCYIEIVYDIPNVPAVPDNGHYLVLDPGLHNLYTFLDTDGFCGIVGRKWLSIERNCWRKVSELQSVWYAQQAAHGIKYPKISRHIQAVYEKRDHQMYDYLHKVTRWITDYCVRNDISRVILGDITGIRKDNDQGRNANQQLHSWPYNRLRDMLAYKLSKAGIILIDQEESWTSQCSPLSPEVSKKYAVSDNRLERGLFRDGDKVWNADAVGAFNILRKWLAVYHPRRKLKADIIATPVVVHVAV